MSKPIFRLTLEEARAELLRVIPGTWRQEMLRARIGQLKRKEADGDAGTSTGAQGDRYKNG